VRLKISDHAMIRYRERISGKTDYKQIKKQVAGKLQSQLRIGLDAISPGCFLLEVFPDMLAVLTIDTGGYWVVLTFYRGDELTG